MIRFSVAVGSATTGRRYINSRARQPDVSHDGRKCLSSKKKDELITERARRERKTQRCAQTVQRADVINEGVATTSS
jgi:hypothetical protein